MGEALRLVRILRLDPGTQLAASVEDWEHPTDRTTAVLQDIFDLQQVTGQIKKPKPYPRGWKQKSSRESSRMGDRAGQSNEAVLALLRPAG